MKIYIALFRGINVGGNSLLPMKELVTILENLGSQSVKTYIQSGNAVFQHKAESAAELSNKIRAAIRESHGFEPQVLLLDVAEMEQAIAATPSAFPQAASDPKALHLYFLANRPENPDLKTLDRLKLNNEQYHLNDRVFYLYAPDGIGRSKLAAQAEKTLGVVATARNWRSVGEIMAMAKQYG